MSKHQTFTKEATFRSDAWLRSVRQLACVCCMREGVQAAHRNQGKAMGMKTSDAWTVPLCPECHSEFDQGRKWDRQTKREMFDAWLILTIDMLARRGLVKA